MKAEDLTEGYINELAKKIHQANKDAGWWDDPNPCIITKLQLVICEIAEATEAERKNLMDDKLPHRKGGEVELADALIRMLDLGGYLGLRYSKDSCPFDLEPFCENVGAMHFLLSQDVSSFNVYINPQANTLYSLFIDRILKVGELLGYDIMSALHEKLEYNKTREDHKRENRAKTNGKKF